MIAQNKSIGLDTVCYFTMVLDTLNGKIMAESDPVKRSQLRSEKAIIVKHCKEYIELVD